jgi:antitoxin FitA
MIAVEMILAQVIVRNLEESVKRELKRRAARHGRSMTEEIRVILREAVKDKKRSSKGLGTEIVELFRGIGLDEPIQELRSCGANATRLKDGERRAGFGTESAKLFRGIGHKKPIRELRGYTIKQER